MRRVEYKNDISAYLCFLIMSPYLYFTSFSFLEQYSATVLNIFMILDRIIEHVSTECRV